MLKGHARQLRHWLVVSFTPTRHPVTLQQVCPSIAHLVERRTVGCQCQFGIKINTPIVFILCFFISKTWWGVLHTSRLTVIPSQAVLRRSISDKNTQLRQLSREAGAGNTGDVLDLIRYGPMHTESNKNESICGCIHTTRWNKEERQ